MINDGNAAQEIIFYATCFCFFPLNESQKKVPTSSPSLS